MVPCLHVRYKKQTICRPDYVKLVIRGLLKNASARKQILFVISSEVSTSPDLLSSPDRFETDFELSL